MDDSAVQTAVCVIGHPIAGNPSQFCTLRALTAMGLEWQCLSFDVPADSLPAAIAGIDALRFAGALIAAPHHSAAAALLASPDTPAAEPGSTAQPEFPSWIDGLQRDEDDQLVGCNFLGEAFGQLLQRHEEKTGQPLRYGVYLGDADSFATAIAPFKAHLPARCFVLGSDGLLPWPAAAEGEAHAVAPDRTEPPSVAPPSLEAQSASNPQSAPSGPAAALGGPAESVADDPPTKTEAADRSAAADAAAEPDHADQADPTTPVDPMQLPVLLLRRQETQQPTKKGAAKPKASAQQDLTEALLDRLHPDSLQITLPPAAGSWQVLSTHSQAAASAISPLDLEIGRIAAAIRAWTGLEADRELLAEAIEEYLEV